MNKISNNTLNVIVILVVAVAAAGLVWYFFIRDKQPSQETMAYVDAQRKAVVQEQPQQQAPQQRRQSGPVLVLFYGDHCPHCHSMMPAWEETKSALAGKMEIKSLESQNPEIANYVPPKGVPTVRYYPAGVENQQNFVDYHGDRSAQSLVNFALSGGQQ